MQFGLKTKSLLFWFTLIISGPSKTGLSEIWQATRSKASNATSWVASQTKQAYNQTSSWVTNQIPSSFTPSYSFSPRELALEAGTKYFAKYIPTTPIANVLRGTSFISNKLLHQLDPILIPQFNSKNRFRHAPASVRAGLDLPVEEQLLMQRRKTYTTPALEKFLGIALPEGQTLNIGFCGSGGGYRAMLSTVGFLNGASKIGLLDTVDYMSALSGSTWALGPWTSLDIPIDQFRAQLINKTQNMLSIAGKEILPAPDHDQLLTLFKILQLKYLFHQAITSVDLWGAMIANKLFEGLSDRQNIYLSDQRKIIEDGKHIFPIYTAVHPLEKLNYDWFEFTPYEAGSTNLAAFTPIWAFGRKFLNGTSISSTTVSGKQFAPEQTLGFYLGIFGSAFTVNLNEILDMMRQDEAVDNQDVNALEIKVKIIEKLASSLAGIKDLRQARISPAQVMNFTHGLDGSPLKDLKKLTLVDAGLAFNLPLPPLLRPERQLDIIFIFDASADVGMAGELKKAERYARANNLPFPEIDYNQAKTQAISVFRDETNRKIPTIIYMPLIKDLSLPSIASDPRFTDFDPKACVEKDYCSTFNFQYEQEEFETLTLLTEHNLADNRELIATVFTQALAVKYSD
jgi:hypothetical protein